MNAQKVADKDILMAGISFTPNEKGVISTASRKDKSGSPLALAARFGARLGKPATVSLPFSPHRPTYTADGKALWLVEGFFDSTKPPTRVIRLPVRADGLPNIKRAQLIELAIDYNRLEGVFCVAPDGRHVAVGYGLVEAGVLILRMPGLSEQ